MVHSTGNSDFIRTNDTPREKKKLVISCSAVWTDIAVVYSAARLDGRGNAWNSGINKINRSRNSETADSFFDRLPDVVFWEYIFVKPPRAFPLRLCNPLAAVGGYSSHQLPPILSSLTENGILIMRSRRRSLLVFFLISSSLLLSSCITRWK